jgi:hypothetical protein
MANTMNTTPYVESVDSNQDLTVQCATIQSLFECSSPSKNKQEKIQFSSNEEGQDNHLENLQFEDELRRLRGTIVDNKTGQVVQEGSFFPYEFNESEQDKCQEKMEGLKHKLEDMDVQYSYEGTIIRIFYYKQWYISTHRKLDSGRSKWGSNNSFKFLFEEGLKESYNISLKDLLNQLNLRCQYTFMIMADENTRFVCTPNHPKKVYFVGSNDPNLSHLKVKTLPKPKSNFNSIDEIFNFVKGMSYPFNYQGLLLVHNNGSQYRIISNEYSKLFKVRNNEQSIPYRYLQLKGQNDQESVDLLKKLFPQYIPTFESHEKYIAKLVDIIYVEYNKRKQRSLLPGDLTTVQQIDQKLYLFIKNRLLGVRNNTIVTPEYILQLLWLEEPSNLNHMIRMVKYTEYKEEQEQKLIINFEKVNLNQTPNNPIPSAGVCAPKKKKVKYTQVPIEFSCRKKLSY